MHIVGDFVALEEGGGPQQQKRVYIIQNTSTNNANVALAC